MSDKRPTWNEVLNRAYLVLLSEGNHLIDADRLLHAVTALAPLHSIPSGYTRRTQAEKMKVAQTWLKENASKVKLKQHSHLEKALLAEQSCPGSNFYDTCFGAWHLCPSDTGIHWKRSTAAYGRALIQCVTDEEGVVRALVALAVQLSCAVTVPAPTSRYGSGLTHDRLILTPPSENRFNKGGDCRSVKGLAPGTALLFLHEPENTGRLIYEEDGRGVRSYGIVVVPGTFYALQLTQPGFEPLEKSVKVNL